MTPDATAAWLDTHLHRFDLPSQYLGTEPNAWRKPWDTATVRWLMMACWPYEQAAGNSSIPAVYKAVNAGRADFLADRFYLPATPRDLKMLDKSGVGVFGIESRHPATDFDVVATSLAYPVLAMSFAKLLTVAGIPLRWRDRDPDTHPMVMAGGQSYGAPEVIAPIVDCWWLGEVEDEDGNPGITDLNTRIHAFHATGAWTGDRLDCYRELAREFGFLYFPRFITTHYRTEDRGLPHPSKRVAGYSSTIDGMRLPLRRRYIRNLDAIAPLDDPPLLYADPAMGSGDLEVARGCSAWCSFCSLTWRAKPYRQHSVEYTTAYGKTMQNNMGSVRLAPFSPDFPMHTQRKKLITSLLENVSDEVDAPSMRVDDFVADHQFILVQVHGGMDSVTLGVEGNCLEGSARIQVPGVGLLRLDEVGAASAKTVMVGGQEAELASAQWTGRRGLVRVTLSDGSHLLATPEHLIRTVDRLPHDERVTPPQRATLGVTSNYLSRRMRMDRCGEVWTEAGALTPGTVLRSYYGQMRWPTQQVAALDEPTAWLLGVLSGDGKVGAWGIEIRVDDPGVEARALEVLQLLGVAAHVRESRRVVTGYSVELAHRLARLGVVDTQSRRRVPDDIWRSPRAVVAAYLSGVLDADGCVPARPTGVPMVVHGTHVESFARDLGQLAAALGHPVTLRRNVGAGGYLMWHTEVHSAPDADWSWLQFAETTRRAKLAAALLRQGLRTGQVSWRGGAAGVKYVTVRTVEPVEGLSDVYDLTVPQLGAFTANGIVVHNSQRMRDLVGKGTADEDIKEAVARGIRAGIRKVKLFMIINLPGEDDGDIRRIIDLARALADIRDSMNQPTVQIQFSWTPLMIEANTPMQWFAATPTTRTLAQVFEDLRPLKILFKIGAKGEPNKAAFFQLTQRACRDVGEAIVDALEEVDQGFWGGVPRTFADLLEAKLRSHGFANGFADCFDERDRDDLFGWEHIDTGVAPTMLWQAYLQMREFLENTDSETYDEQLDDAYRGAEWISRCDTTCHGKKCGACTHADLKIRTGYLRAPDPDLDLSTIAPVDQRSQAVRVRVRIHRDAAYRMVGNDHWRFAIRRAAFRAQDHLATAHGIAKRSIRFASDDIRYRDWTAGVDYVEFALTRPADTAQIATFLSTMDTHLRPGLALGEWTYHPPAAPGLRSDVAAALYEIDTDVDLPALHARLIEWHRAPHIPMRLTVVGGYFAPDTETVNAKDFVTDLWPVREKTKLRLRMLIAGKPNPYNVYAALMRRPSWLDAAGNPARRLEVFIHTDTRQTDFLRPTCTDCGLLIPVTVLDQPYRPDRCPRCHDTATGALLTFTTPTGGSR